MDRNFYDNDFEEFLKQKSDQYKMYPSDRVWNNVYSSLHGRKKWWAVGFILFFISAGMLIGRQVILSDLNRVTAQLNTNSQPLSAALPYNSTVQPVKSRQYAAPGKNENTGNTAADPAISARQSTKSNNIPYDNRVAVNGQAAPGTLNQAPMFAGTEHADRLIENDLLPAIITGTSQNVSNAAAIQPKTQVTEGALKTKDISVKETAADAPVNQVDNAVPASSIKPSKWSVQLYASPTVSYRRLSSVDQQAGNPVPAAAGYSGDINRYVHHRPAPGFELGTNIQYKLSENLSVFAGAQLNYSRYYINAFKYQTEKASIALDKAFVHDTLSGYTDIRNFSGYAPEQLQNKYLQLSVPVGIEIKLLGHKKLQFNVAGSLQPTFLLASTSYLLSSDYKNYIQSPDLARTFNVHTNFEAFISYQSGGFKWQVGPQFRSQLLSSYSNQYRVREYLTEYGIKIGVTKTFR